MFRIADHITSAVPVSEGSHVYKVLRNDGRISAVEVFPFAMGQDQYGVFTQQVNLLTEAQSQFRTSIPAVLSWGFTLTGNFSYVEREWIEGYDITELPNTEKAVTTDEIGTIAEQMSRVLTHCHSLEVVHGNITPKDILWDKDRGQYCLTGFGVGLQAPAPASKNSTGQPGALQQLSPSKEKDVHDLGLVLFQLLNQHLLANEKIKPVQPGNALANEKLKDGTIMPAWLAVCITKALSTGKEKFKSAHEMYNYIIQHHKTPLPANRWYRSKPQQPITAGAKQPAISESPSRKKLRSALSSGLERGKEEMRFVFDRRIALGLVIAGMLAGFSIVAQNREKEKTHLSRTKITANIPQQDTIANTVEETIIQIDVPPVTKEKKKTITPKKADKKETIQKVPPVVPTTTEGANTSEVGAYKVRSKAYFHNQPDETTKRNAFIVHWNNATLRPTKEENGFVYVVFTNHEGQTSKGWLRKKDLIKL